MKVARTVLNGESGSNAADLHNFLWRRHSFSPHKDSRGLGFLRGNIDKYIHPDAGIPILFGTILAAISIILTIFVLE